MKEIPLTQRDHDILETFMERAETMRSAGYFQRYTKRTMTIEGKEQEVEVATDSASEDEIAAVINWLRAFYLQQEDINYLSVNSKLRRMCEKAELNEWVEHLQSHRQHWLDSLRHAPIGIKRGDEKLTPDVILDLYFYGKYAKQDIDKHKRLKELGSLTPIVRFLLMNIIDNLFECIYRTANVYFCLRRDHKLVITEIAQLTA